MKMKLKLLAIASLALAAAACDRGADAERADDPAAQTQPQPGTPGADPTAATTGTQPGAMPAPDATASDEEALGLLAAINQHEIEAAQAAQEKGVQGEVLAYAQRMEREHGENQRKLESLGQPAQTEAVRMQEEKGRSERERLASLEGEEFSRAYVEAMVKDHGEALATLDGKLIPAASDQAVRAHLEETRGHVAAHLEAAEALQGQQSAQQ